MSSRVPCSPQSFLHDGVPQIWDPGASGYGIGLAGSGSSRWVVNSASRGAILSDPDALPEASRFQIVGDLRQRKKL